MQITTHNRPWTALEQIGFRFLFAFLFLNIALSTFVPFIGSLWGDYHYYPAFVVQNYLLDLHETPKWKHSLTGSGDSLDDWTLQLAYFGIALIVTLIWTLFDRRRKNYAFLSFCTKIGVRYYLAYVMFVYGILKMFALQMPYPSLTQFYTPLGDFTPMRFTWMYIGYSEPYQFLSGFLEALGGLLILFRRTLLVGLLLLLGVLGNVVLLNFLYGVPVKLFSATLWLMCIYLLAEYVPKLINFFLLNKQETINRFAFNLTTPWKKYGRLLLKYGFIAYAIFTLVRDDMKYYQSRQKTAPFELEGAFDVYSFKTNGIDDKLAVDTTRWNQIVINKSRNGTSGFGHVLLGTSIREGAIFRLDSLNQLSITPRGDRLTAFEGTHVKAEDGFTWEGMMGKDSVQLMLRRNEKEFTLDTREFMWIMEQKDF